MTGRRADQVELLALADRQIGARLRDLRRARGMTQAALAELAGVASQQVAKYETGVNGFAAAGLWIVARALGVETQVFFEGMERLLAAGGEASDASAGAEAVLRALEAQQEGVQLADIFRRISNRRTREMLLTLSRELARNG